MKRILVDGKSVGVEGKIWARQYEGSRVSVDGRAGTIREVFNGDSVSVEFDDRPGVVMIVDLNDPTLLMEERDESFEGFKAWLRQAIASGELPATVEVWRDPANGRYIANTQDPGEEFELVGEAARVLG